MKKTLLYLLCATVALSSCKNDDDDNNGPAGGGTGSAAMRVASVSAVEDGAQSFTASMSYTDNKLTDQLAYFYEGGTQPSDSSLNMVEYDGDDITTGYYEGVNGAWVLSDREIRTVSGGKLITSQYYGDGGALSNEKQYIYSGDQLTQQIFTSYFSGTENELTYDYVYVNDRLDVREQRNSDGTLAARTRIAYTGSNATSRTNEFLVAGNWQATNRTEYDYTNGVVTETRYYNYDFLTQEQTLTSTETYLYNGAGQVTEITYTDPEDMSSEVMTITFESGSSNLDEVFGDPENGLLDFEPIVF